MLLIYFIILLSFSHMPADSSSTRIIHVIVALCDNENQGIIPVPATLGNGRDAKRNLYWGAMYGFKTVMKKNRNWIQIHSSPKYNSNIAERIIYKNKENNIYLVADAYYGDHIYEAIECFVNYIYRNDTEIIKIGDLSLLVGGNSELVIYAGHDGLMEFDLKSLPKPIKASTQKYAVLACFSKEYFAPVLKNSGSHPLIWTSGLMAPEGYLIEAIINGWASGKSDQQIHQMAAEAYHMYQGCGIKSAKRLFLTGW